MSKFSEYGRDYRIGETSPPSLPAGSAGTVEVFCDTEDDGPGASYFDGPAWRGVVRLDSWECRQMPAALEAYRDERVFLQWPVAVCDFDPTQVDGAEDYFD